MRHTHRGFVIARQIRQPARRSGFTIAELIVAVVLLTVGLIALAGTSTWVFREMSMSRRTERAADLARARLELLRLRRCAAGIGMEVHGDLLEQWTLVADAHRATAVVSIVARDSGQMPAQRYQAAFPC